MSLPGDDKRLIRSLTSQVEPVGANQDISRDGDKPGGVNLIASGFAFRYKLLSGGNRQILGILMPGDFCELHAFFLDAMDHGIATLTEAQLVRLPRRSILDLLDRPAISRAMLLATLVDEATLREWLINVGQRSAETRVAHFLCEWHLRHKAANVAGDACAFPFTQAHLAEALGLSAVHVSRVLKRLRERELIVITSRQLIIPDVEERRTFSGFRADYLHRTPLS